MYYPDLPQFLELASEFDTIPVYRELLADVETPVSAFQKLPGGPYRFLLESVEGGERVGRYSILGSSSEVALSIPPAQAGDGTGSLEAGNGVLGPLHPLRELRRILGRQRVARLPGLPPFYGGAVGYLGFDALSSPGTASRPRQDGDGGPRFPEAFFLLARQVIVFDHARQVMLVVVNVQPGAGDPEASYREAQREIDGLIARLQAPSPDVHPLGMPPEAAAGLPVESNMTREEFEDAVRRAKARVAAGEVRQVVLSQRLTVDFDRPPLQLYRVLRSLNPSPYMFYLDCGGFQMVGSSPEVMVRGSNGTALLRPIAGTRPRGGTPEEDERLAAELLADEKERDEHMMLVDLGREDLQKVCRPGSVAVDQLMAVERYSHVMHLVSDVTGQLDGGKDTFDLLEACFPAGTVSGAPRDKALEIIAELEPTRRGPYGGAVCYFSFSGDMDSCITIRTALIQGGRAHIQVGAGIVAGSVPSVEYEETLNKARGMLKALALAKGATTSYATRGS